MTKFTKSINQFATCEVHAHGNVRCFAKLANSNWTAVKDDGSLDNIEMTSDDFCSMLEAVESVGASVRFTNHSAI